MLFTAGSRKDGNGSVVENGSTLWRYTETEMRVRLTSEPTANAKARDSIENLSSADRRERYTRGESPRRRRTLQIWFRGEIGNASVFRMDYCRFDPCRNRERDRLMGDFVTRAK
jgi:hypothetical protein